MLTVGDNGTTTVFNSTPATGDTKLVVKAGAGQASNLQEWQANGGAVLAQIADDGGGYGLFNTFGAGKSGSVGPEGVYFVDAATGFNSAAFINASTLTITDTSPSGSTELAVTAGAGQSANNLQTWRNAAGTVLSAISNTGAFTGNTATATALAANGTNCSAGSYPLGVDAAGNAESCTAASGSGTVTSVSVTTANGVSGSVATATSTPAITLTLGAITPASVAAVGAVTGSNLSGTNTGDQTTVSGNAGTATALQTARLINGTSFNGSADITITANLPSNPTACTAGQYVSDIAADGTLTCGTPAGGSGTTQAQALTLVSFRF